VALSRLPAIAVSIAALMYPFGVYLAAGRVAPHWLLSAMCLLPVARAASTRDVRWLGVAAVTAMLALGSVYAGQSHQMLKFYPVVVNAGLLAMFAASVFYPPTVIERLARLAEPDLPPEAVRYTRRVTQVWCGFFVLWASDVVWALCNGFLSYVAMGLLFAGEWLVRQRMKVRVSRCAGRARHTSGQLKDADA
jgi:uncharacterized membrane protein